ncbi:MFS transporter [Rhodococcus sp. CX]|uniref:MFS transporter n=1 Tax=Rhodococcus sp. CX TaxID=2789880 RepID=UPI0018CE0272|nr:MFS transporter [Rhodococcus sp. CX]
MTRAQWWLLIVACAAVALVVAAMASLNMALPDIAVDIGATQSELTWIVDSYTLVLAALLLPAGALGDRYGRRGVLVAGLAVVAVSSALPLVLDSPTWIIAARGLAGLGAALVMPATLSVITAGFPEERRARAVGVWAGTAGAGCIAGLLVSGVILEYSSWIMIFVSFAVAAVVLLVASLTIASSRAQEHFPPDLVGSALSIIAVGLFVFGLMEGPHRGWTDAAVLACIILGLAAATGFVLTELRTPAPLLDVRLFTHRAFGSGALTLLFQFVAMFGVFFIVVQYLQLVLGYSPLGSSIQLIPLILLVMTVSVLIPPLVPRVGLRFLFTGGLAVLTGSFVLIGNLDPQSSTVLINVALLLPGVGLGMVSAPATHAIVSSTPDDKQGVASAVNDATRELGAAIGVAVAAMYGRKIEPVAAAIPDPTASTAVSDSLASALKVAEAAGPRGDELADLARSAFLAGMQQASWTIAVILAIGAVVAAFLSPGRSRVTKVREPH